MLLVEHNPVWTFMFTCRSPNSTIAVRAAYENSVPYKEQLITLNDEIVWIIHFKGVGDLKDCYHYFSGPINQFINNSVGNWDDSIYICNIKITLIHGRPPLIFWTDSHVSVFLRLFTEGDKID